MKKFLILSFACLPLLANCKKEFQPYSLVGFVTDINGNPIAGANVSFSAYYRGGLFSGGGYYEMAKARTDAQGKYSVPFKLDSTVEKFMIQVFADNYFPYLNSDIFRSHIQNNVLTLNSVFTGCQL